MAEQHLLEETKKELMQTLKERFEQNEDRHVGIQWQKVEARLEAYPNKLLVLYAMEQSGGEPDVIGYEKETEQYVFCDCAKESPVGRRNTCYDGAARESRKTNKPQTSATEMAEAMGVALLNEEQYRTLQTLGEFDVKTSSWIATPTNIRSLGGALFCDRRYHHVFTYHNGAESYYASRGFRGLLKI